MGLGVMLRRGKSFMENPCSSGIAFGRDAKTLGGKLPHSKDLHLVSPRWLLLLQKVVLHHLEFCAGSGLKAPGAVENEVSWPRKCVLGVAALVDIGAESPVRGSSCCCSSKCRFSLPGLRGRGMT